MTYGKKIKQHEIVVPTDPLPVWYFVFHDNNSEKYIAPHWHRGIELSYVEHGRIDDFLINKKHYSSKSGTILVVNTQEIHSIRAFESNNALALSIIFPYDYLANLYPDIAHQIIKINDPTNFSSHQKLAYFHLQGLLGQFIKLYFLEVPTKHLEQQRLIDEILCLLLTNFTEDKKGQKQISDRKAYIINRLQYITQYVNNHYQEELNLALIANKCNISKEYLARFFKKEMELTVETYINNVRAEHAYQELKSQKKNLTQIAIDNGFSSIRTMNRAFDKLYGKSASKMKKDLVK
ncbi:AraC family transcriptional regulator [Lactobacillus johnsonii]|uniref:AraC family transcriptional regulator n=1 Tax=Lactobacillus johnsonii TaxID=33959 RepID=A0AAX0PU96_LACJH|nr:MULTISPECIES: AraC family transcriptional regulator [Lactobacillus]ARW75233.1 AraC family transcriptional regulator [Lactobacillus johnsonii]ARW76808.1 AraC family transcriptional regulator [Lactobacillus johnsonii]PAB52273.1 AraC family transcriptional regulator [Lactobacillus johnsonii]PEG77122.1 AraC family transcriptional regulator [Lactobacillus sp. UMNPBX19]